MTVVITKVDSFT
jgi:hypothetical protein